MYQVENTSELEDQRSRHKLRFRLIAAAAVALLIAALILTPPLINLNRYRRRITTTMSQSLGRPVHLDNVSLHLLPVPGLTLQNLVVSEDPAFGAEPVIRANTVEATLRASSLWRRQVEFSTVRFIDPSVNLVRNGQGRWNLEGVLMQAAHVETAPTAQRRAGPSPRFPYIEATGARVNVKLGEEKMPFSLTETQFALWQPSPQQWRVRLVGKPTRTDSNVSETGLLRLDGSLQKGATVADVPVDLHLSWRGAPLGEASRLLSGDDAGWRGTLFLELGLTGPLSKASVTTHLQLNDLRRADFVPAQPLDVTLNCAATSDVVRAVLTDAQCSLPVDDTKPVALTAPVLDLQNPRAAAAKAAVSGLPVHWVLDWARLFTPRIPATAQPGGALTGQLTWNSAAGGWQGQITAAAVPPASSEATPAKTPGVPATPVFRFDVDTSAKPVDGTAGSIVRLEPAVVHPDAGASLTLSGQCDAKGYVLQLSGTGTAAEVHTLADTLPPFDEDVGRVLPAPAEPDAPHALSLSCARLWGGPQTCEPLVQPPATRPSRLVKRRR